MRMGEVDGGNGSWHDGRHENGWCLWDLDGAEPDNGSGRAESRRETSNTYIHLALSVRIALSIRVLVWFRIAICCLLLMKLLWQRQALDFEKGLLELAI
jgi:hypothetical protein